MIPMSILTALANVGEAPVSLRFNTQLFPVELLRSCGAKFPGQISVGDLGDVAVTGTGPSTRESLRRFTNALLESARARE
jgi:hypothetical protein